MDEATPEMVVTTPLVGKRIILAEDDEITRKVMVKVLGGMGAEVIEARDGGRLLVAVTSHYKEGRSPNEIDLIVTDVRMPVIGGLDVFRAVRAARWTTPVLVVSAYESVEVIEAAERLDAVLLPKPLDLERFESVVRALVARPRRSSGMMRSAPTTHGDGTRLA